MDEAGGNFAALAFVTIGFFKERQQSPLEFWHYAGATFAISWKVGGTALEMARYSAFEWASIGAHLVELTGDDHHGMAVLAGWPPPGVHGPIQGHPG